MFGEYVAVLQRKYYKFGRARGLPHNVKCSEVKFTENVTSEHFPLCLSTRARSNLKYLRCTMAASYPHIIVTTNFVRSRLIENIRTYQCPSDSRIRANSQRLTRPAGFSVSGKKPLVSLSCSPFHSESNGV